MGTIVPAGLVRVLALLAILAMLTTAHAASPALDQQLIDTARDGRTDKVGKGDADKIGSLLDQGADPNAKDQHGDSALTWALNFGKDDAAQLLIKHGADGSGADASGENGAWLAAKIYYCPGALDLLIKKGVDVKGQNTRGRTILMAVTSAVAARPGQMNYLHDRVWTDAEYQSWQEREHRTIDLLIAAGADFNGKDGVETPLMHAIQSGRVEAAQTLIGHGADLKLKDENGNTAVSYIFLWAGSQPLRIDLLETMLKAGADANAPYYSFTTEARTPISLLEAVMYAPAKTPEDTAALTKAVQLLLEHGADPAFKDAQGNTALSLAEQSHQELVPLLSAPAK